MTLEDDLLAVTGRKRATEDELVGVRKKRAVAVAPEEQPATATASAPAPAPATAPAQPAPAEQLGPSESVPAAAPAPAAAPSQPDGNGQSSDEGSDESGSSSDSDSSEDFGGLAIDRADRKRLRRMPELEREIELEERAAKKDEVSFRAMLTRKDQPKKDKKAARPKRAAKPCKAAAVAAEELADLGGDAESDDDFGGGTSEEGVRRSSRKQRGRTSKEGALEGMKAARARDAAAAADESADDSAGGLTAGQRARAQQRREAAEADYDPAAASPSESGGSHRRDAGRFGASDEASDVSVLEDEDEEAPQSDVMPMQVKRTDLEEWIKQPNLEDVLIGAVVRVALGTGKESEGQYSMCLVHDVSDGKQYTFNGVHSTFETDKHLIIVDARDQRQHTINFTLVSNADLRADEFDRFHEARANNGVGQITVREALECQARLQRARNYTLSSEDISRIVREKKQKGLVKRSLAMHKAELILQRNAAAEAGDTEAEARIKEKLEQVMAQVAERDADEHEAKERLSRLNKKAMLANRAREQAAKKAAQNQKGQRTGGYDPYSRKATKVVQYWTTKKREDDKQAAVDELQAQQSVQARMSAAEELAGLELRTCAGELSQAQMMTRRLLGPQYRFVRSTNVDRSGKQVISLEQYQDMARRQGFDNLGLTL